MKIILIGFMGSGKSTVAKHAAKELNFELFEMDEYVVENSQLPSIVEIIDKLGEAHFRELETKACEHAGGLEDIVISAGGGVIERDHNMSQLQSGSSLVVYLETTFAEALKRIKESGKIETRPLLRDLEFAEKLHASRAELYLRYADLTISTDGLTPQEACNELVTHFLSSDILNK